MKSRILLVGCVLALATLCEAKVKPPLFASPDFNPSLVQRVDVFVVDKLQDEKNDRECVGGARWGADMSLGRRGYNKEKHERTQYYNDPIGLTDAMLANPTKDWLQDLANRKYEIKSKGIPPPGQWIMVITIDELGSRQNAIKGPGRATLSMYLYDRDQGTMLWHDQMSSKMWGGVMGNLIQKGDIKTSFCAEVTQEMILKLPKHKK
ncbi:MAG TPA: hypothetical protein VJR23_00920 [Candidatus Acidoferrales bacterium]|nr:hypothetical protein [Candidatus Acidoferrales bacterium]